MINEYENTLRRLIINILGGGDKDVGKYKVTENRINQWIEKRNIEQKKNNGILFENRIIFYSDFYDLQTIIDKNWESFLPVLNDKKRWLVFFQEVEKYRNTIAHGRQLIKSQENLLSGIVMDLKNTITIFHNKNNMKEDFFIEIVRITDNLGNSWGKSILERSERPILREGDEYEINIEANDPKDREIEYCLSALGSDFLLVQKSNKFRFVITPNLIGSFVNILVHVRTPESDYKNEHAMDLTLCVLPA
ncbi:hypothetical protein ACSV4D_06005 [Flavobacterium sp. ARAG 55.4]|uniref:hypothetical protein n=1 Tax=Flavobacterium sp. ARAG 55.4 TaxID=3451357 RepID=UPI003F45EAD4